DTILAELLAKYSGPDGDYYRAWEQRYRELISTTVRVAGEYLASQLGFSFDLRNPRVSIAIQRRANKLAGEVTDTTYREIQKAVEAGLETGEGVSTIAKRIGND